MDMAEVGAEQVTEIRRGVIRLAGRLRLERSPSALSPNKVAVLGHLHRNGPSTPGAIAVGEHQRPQSLTRVFADLEQEGLVARVRSSDDRRASILRLTTAGRDALAADMAERDAWLASALARLTDAEVRLLGIAADLMDQVAADAVYAERRVPPAQGGVGSG